MAGLKDVSKGDKVILRLFTGAFVEAKTVEMADGTKIGFTNKKGVKMVFSKETGKQITPEPKSERFASFVEEYSEEAEKEGLAKKQNTGEKKPRKSRKKAKAQEEE